MTFVLTSVATPPIRYMYLTSSSRRPTVLVTNIARYENTMNPPRFRENIKANARRYAGSVITRHREDRRMSEDRCERNGGMTKAAKAMHGRQNRPRPMNGARQ